MKNLGKITFSVVLFLVMLVFTSYVEQKIKESRAKPKLEKLNIKTNTSLLTTKQLVICE